MAGPRGNGFCPQPGYERRNTYERPIANKHTSTYKQSITYE